MDITALATWATVATLVNGVGIFWIKERLKQSIKYEYDEDLERLKKDLDFELDKKKRLYEGKLAQYKKYYALMDSYSTDSRKVLFNSFQEGVLELIQNPSTENTSRYVTRMLACQGDFSDKFLIFKTEMNGLRLEAGEKLLSYLDEYIDLLDMAHDHTINFISSINNSVTAFIDAPEEISNQINEFMNDEILDIGDKMKSVQTRMFKEMRNELGIV